MLNLFIKCFDNPFVDIALIFSDSLFNSFLFEVTFLFNFLFYYQNMSFLQN